MVEEIKIIIEENNRLRRINKKLVENIDIDFFILSWCINAIAPEKANQIIYENYKHHSSDKYTRHCAFNMLQAEKHGHVRIN